MDHFGGHVIETAGTQLHAFAVTPQHRLTGNHGVRLIRGVPMFLHMDRFRSTNEQAGSMRFRINTQKTDFRRTFPEIGNNLVPFQISQILENPPIACRRRRLGYCARMLVNTRSARAEESKKEIWFL